MGEMGYNRHEFLYELKQWEIIATIRGYRKRQRVFCDMTRWQAYVSLMPHVKLKECGINSEKDLLHFSWDNTEEEAISDEDANDLLQLIDSVNQKGSVK